MSLLEHESKGNEGKVRFHILDSSHMLYLEFPVLIWLSSGIFSDLTL